MAEVAHNSYNIKMIPVIYLVTLNHCLQRVCLFSSATFCPPFVLLVSSTYFVTFLLMRDFFLFIVVVALLLYSFLNY